MQLFSFWAKLASRGLPFEGTFTRFLGNSLLNHLLTVILSAMVVAHDFGISCLLLIKNLLKTSARARITVLLP